ncbi:SCP2 domain-containing protein [Litchfieldella qijiaojingensis]|uniref:Ubiquinone biosynthesis accessory factor UbiJ n=1 Tax=Litchfieldella qijiaojingensis TaxID=980347 RepID=A0ABQ2YW81_9GAMM|nr:SCP2 sterol-binding domain-containing protein [Halomonas qijiaojingensis]GGX97367.1 SCP2 domain-containing protein [Halomonas qijiaojingensis]
MLRLLEHTLNTLLSRDPAAPARLARLDGARLLFRLERPHLELMVHFYGQGLHLCHVSDSDECDADAVVEVDSEALGRLLGGESIERLMFGGRLAVRGRTQLLEDTRDLLFDLDLDWEGELSKWLGDTPAHSLAEGVRRLSRWGLRTRQQLHADVSEYVFEEARLLPGRAQFEVLRDQLTELEVATDRLEARLARLNRRLAEGEGGR